MDRPTPPRAEGAVPALHVRRDAPPAPGRDVAVAREDRSFLGGKATLKEVTITLGPPEVPQIHLLLVVPNARQGPRPRSSG